MAVPWQPESASSLLVLVERLAGVLQNQPMNLGRAMVCIKLEDAAGSPAKLWQGGSNWQWAVEQFRFHMVEESGRVQPKTWHRTYRSHMEQTLAVLERPRAPRDGRGVLKALLMAHPTPPGGTGRRERLGNAARFLTFAVDHCGIAEQYRPPLDYRDLLGRRLQRKPPATPLLDEQFLGIYSAIEEPRWRLAFGLLGVFGLRPAELGCCRVEQAALHVEGVKRNSSGCHPSRLVHGLDPAGAEGMADALLDQFRSLGQTALPHAAVAAFWSTRIQQHLVRHVPKWPQVLADARQSGQGHLTVYGTRHGFAFRGSQLYALSPRVLAALMGHTTAVHLRHYGQWAGDQEIAAAVQLARIKAQS